MSAPFIVDSTPLIVPAIVFGSASLSAGALAMLLPETRGKPLPDYIVKPSEDDATDSKLKGNSAEMIPLAENNALVDNAVA